MKKMRMLAIALAVAACGSKDSGDDEKPRSPADDYRREAGRSKDQPVNLPVVAEPPPAAAAAPAKPMSGEGAMGKKNKGDAFGTSFAGTVSIDADKEEIGGQERPAAAQSRAWFPETFLFEPLVVTNAHGNATVEVRVPDRLTTWRVLALAHSRSGAQAGATTSFLGTLPTYVDPVSPPFLMVGDEVRLPIQAVNTTDAAVTSPLHVEAAGATAAGGAPSLTLAAQGSEVTFATVKAEHPGDVKLRVSLGSTDAVVKTFSILPTGKPEVRTASGTLAAPRTVEITGPEGSDPASDHVRLSVFPGALALLRTEMGASIDRNGLAEDAYALLLVGRAPALLKAMGGEPDSDNIRRMEILLTQRAVRWGRTLDVDTATLLTAAALAHPQNQLLARLGERAAAWLAANQRPDGTFGGANGWTLQRVLVTTADGLRALHAAADSPTGKQRALAADLRAAGAFERNLARVDDGYTAAAILAAGVVKGDNAAKLQKLVLASLTTRPDGAKVLIAPKGVVRADGTRPSEAEGTALAVLALQDVKDAPLADMGGALLGAYSPADGWGNGRADLICMQAVLLLFKDPVPAGVKITLTMDGQAIAADSLDPRKPYEVLTLNAPSPLPGTTAGLHKWGIVAEPAVAGLAYNLTLQSWVPWGKQPAREGVELDVPATVDAVAGKPVEVTVRAAAPAREGFTVIAALPAGVQVDTAAMDALRSAGTIEAYRAADGRLEMDVAPLQPGQTWAAKLRLIPTLAGTLHSSASTVRVAGLEAYAPPSVWTIR